MRKRLSVAQQAACRGQAELRMFNWFRKKPDLKPAPTPVAPAFTPSPLPPIPERLRVGMWAKVILNNQNTTPREGTIRQIGWHDKLQIFHYRLECGGRLVKKRYTAEDLEPHERPACLCTNAWKTPHDEELRLHREIQFRGEAWKRLLDYIETTAANNAEEFAPGVALGWELWRDITVLPPTIAKLKSVKRMHLYGSTLVCIPPEIGEMTCLEDFDPYTSYYLHWFPYEITRCKNLRRSRVSTRALYGNCKHRPPFPDLGAENNRGVLKALRPGTCSVCGKSLMGKRVQRRWTSQLVATDVMPLLVFACSDACVNAVPDSPDGYVRRPHCGGPWVKQPESGLR